MRHLSNVQALLLRLLVHSQPAGLHSKSCNTSSRGWVCEWGVQQRCSAPLLRPTPALSGWEAERMEAGAAGAAHLAQGPEQQEGEGAGPGGDAQQAQQLHAQLAAGASIEHAPVGRIAVGCLGVGLWQRQGGMVV